MPYRPLGTQRWTSELTPGTDYWLARLRARHPTIADTGAAGALWASCINHTGDGVNASTMTCAPAKPGILPCTGLANFPHGLTVKVTNATDLSWWATNLTIPWGIFPGAFAARSPRC